MSEECKHAIGIAEIEYHPDVICVGDRLMAYQHFGGWDFCPYCGKSVADEVAEMIRQIEENEVAWEKEHGARLGK